jgi:hypothetical protein
MNKQNLVRSAWVLGALAGCSAAGGSMGSSSGDSAKMDAAGTWSPGGAYGSGGVTININGGGGAAGSGTTALPAEQEQKVDFLAPRAGANYVYVANPTRNTVDAINSTTLAITELTPGDSPTYVATVPGQDIALVINAGSHTLRLITGETLNTSPIAIISKANAIAIAPDGAHAVIWFDSSVKASGTTSTTTTATSTTTATGSTQEVSVVTIASQQAYSMSVGYNPSAVVFSSDNAAAFVVTDDGISELRFAKITGDAIAPFTRFNSTTTSSTVADAGAAPSPDTRVASPDLAPALVPDTAPSSGGTSLGDARVAAIDGELPSLDGGSAMLDGASPDTTPSRDLVPPSPDLVPPATPDTAPVSPPPANPSSLGKPVDISVTADGAYAIARRDGSADLLLVDLKAHLVTSLRLSSEVTDLKLLDTPPSGGAAFAVLRDESMLVRIDIPSGFTDTAHRKSWPFPGVTVGIVAMSPQGKYAVLYTTAKDENIVVIKDLTQDVDPTFVNLHMAIGGVAIAPDEQTAMVLHAPPLPGTGGNSGSGGKSGSGGSSGSAVPAFGYTMVHLVDGFSKLQQTAAKPDPFAITPDSLFAFVLLRDDKNSVRIAERISLTSYIADDFLLGSPPTSIAALSAATHKVFVGQFHPEGRISFIDWKTRDMQSVTGFALNGRIQQ